MFVYEVLHHPIDLTFRQCGIIKKKNYFSNLLLIFVANIV